jgi:hypothetical protein
MKSSSAQHPTFDDLLALSLDELPPGRSVEVREHLLDCPSCLQQIRGLAQFPNSPPEPQMEIVETEATDAWNRLDTILNPSKEAQPQVRPFHDTSGQVVQIGNRRTGTARWRPSPLWLAAALLVGAGIGLLARRPFSVETDPAAGAGLTHLISQEFQLRGPAEADDSDAKCPPAGGTYVWIMTFTKRPADEKEAQVTLLRQGGATIRLSPKPINDKGQVVLALPWERIENGKYTVELAAEGDGEPIREQFPISVDCR